ncbi:MAG: DEAD/DEAH box helicase [Ruminococcaceae bacterium]|nr:DEAD/DEAH box helicase [Oscillospiraceae bacterium]
MSEIFDRFPYFIREFIYAHHWEALRDVQVAAAEAILNTDHNLLLTSSTASGKTEAAFFPVLTLLCEEMPASVGVLYVAPLKSLINDQFYRIEELLSESGIPVTHWHGDVSQSHKKKLLENPRGILQVTPESLEAMLINRSNDIVRLFGDLRFVIIDEIHTLTGSDRGNQIICQLSRLGQKIGHHPRRIGLSATVGDAERAAAWLSAGSGRETVVPRLEEGRIRWRLGMEHFYIQNSKTDQATEPKDAHDGPAALGYDAGYSYMYDCVSDRKSLVFSNSREETEYVCATLRQIAKMRGERDVFLIHHGNLSASIREEAEEKMKDEELLAVTCATVTMELGIDIGRLERILQNQSPNSVMSFLQRLGRSGRRGQPPEMMMVFREEDPLPNMPLPQLIPWELIKAIAIVQLYIEDRFIEPPRLKALPMSLLFHQTLSVLASSGELKLSRLAERVLSLPPFENVPREDYKALIVSMLNNDFLEMTEEKTLIIGLAGERLLRSFKFYAVFKDSEDYTVRCGADEIGTITTPPPVGDRFALAGRVWEVEELDIQHKLVYVKSVEGKMEVSWPGDFGEVHTRILERMRSVLEEDTVYPYLKPNAQKRLEQARHVARNTGMLTTSVIHLGGYSYCMFPWLGTKAFRAMRRMIKKHSAALGITGVEYEGCYFITFKMTKGNEYELTSYLADRVREKSDSADSLVAETEIPILEKYDDYIPPSLLRKSYARDALDFEKAQKRILEIEREF